ncbi:GGDEF domain-containing protein [Nitratireductor sp. GCM10026969]|uniref:GGDEF domain-containing protein n=1 Tax=Nitratireductor sp. GCM10026969 TaxID=3252645 RepID=UPI00360CB9D9
MRGRATSIIARASVVTVVAVAATYAVFLAARGFLGVPYTRLDLVECGLIPVVVGFPIASYVFLQLERLRAARDALSALNAEMQSAHRQLKVAHELMAYAASHDKMTGLPNRERFLDRLEDAHRNSEEDVLLIVDADHFKQINDRLGHLKGDDALVEIARAIRRSVREKDVVGRIGGEEFGVLLKDVDLAQAAETAERMRRAVEQIPWCAPNGLSRALTVSIGGAALRDHPAKVSDVLSRADRCLYAAKHSGRNCIAFGSSIGEVA